jgi:DNA ligase (NAD+)
LGDKLVAQLVDAGLVATYGDLYRLRIEDLEVLERMGRRSAEKLVAQIEASKERGLARLLNALSIRHVGETVAEVLAAQFGDVDRLSAALLDDLHETPEIGDIIAKSVYDFLHSEYGRAVIEDLRQLGVAMSAPSSHAAVDARLAGKTFVVTGTLARRSRDEMHELIKWHGGKVSSSVSAKTHFVIAGEEAGSKLAKAKSLGVPVISEDDFDAMLE